MTRTSSPRATGPDTGASATPSGMTVHGLAFSAEIIGAVERAIRIMDNFRFEDVRSAVWLALPSDFDFGIQHKESVVDRLGDRLLQRARRSGIVRHGGGGTWQAVPQDIAQ